MTGDIRLKNLSIAFLAVRKLKNWFEYFLDLFNIGSKRLITFKSREGLKFVARAKTMDRGIITTVYLEDEYGLKDLPLSKESSVIIDIGGQNGYLSTYASKYAKKIYTYEPIEENFKIIKKNIKLNNLGSVIKPFNLAVSDKKDKLKIFLSQKNTGGHSIYGKGDKFIEIETTTLPLIFKDNNIQTCDLLKMDIEGAEYDIFYNLPSEFFKKIRYIRMEYHNIDNKKRNNQYLSKHLEKQGFSVKCEHPLLFAKNEHF